MSSSGSNIPLPDVISDLASKTTRGAGWRAIETAGSEGLSFILFIILARLLLPEDFGIVALASSIVLSLQCLLQFGLPESLIQRSNLTEENIHSAMTASFVFGLMLVGLTWVIAWPLAWLLGRPEFPPIFLGMSSVLVLQSLSFPLHGLLRRELNMRAIAIRTLMATSLGGITAASLAFNGFGPWSLVAQQLIVASVGLIMLLRVSKYRPWPFRFKKEALQPLLRVARPVMLGQFATQAARRLDAVALGLFLGNHEVGIYFLVTRVVQAVQMVTQFSIGELTLAVLSRLQDEPERMREGVRRALKLTSYVCLLFFGALSLAAPVLVPVVFGQAMADASEPLRILALFATAGAIISTVVHVLVSANAASTSSWVAVGAALVQLAAVFFAARFGMIPLVIAIGAVQLILVLPSFHLLSSHVGLPRTSLVLDQVPILIGFGVSWLAASMIGQFAGIDSALISSMLSALLFGIVMISIGAFIFRRDWPALFRAKKA
ncbi:MAG: lipopolysaccharide biosynthesis protein [Burkholderiaceae bacterium]